MLFSRAVRRVAARGTRRGGRRGAAARRPAARRAAADDRGRGLAAAGGGRGGALPGPRSVRGGPPGRRSRARRGRRRRGRSGRRRLVGQAGRRPAAQAGEPLTVLSANVFTGRADTGMLAALIEREEPDFVVLPEAGCDFRDKLLPLVAHLGYRGWAATPPGVPDIMGVVLLAGPRAGTVRGPAGIGPALPPPPGQRRNSRRAASCSRCTPPRPATAARRPVAARARRRRSLDARRRRRRSWRATSTPPWTTARCGPRSVGASRRRAGGDALVGTYPSGLPRWFGIQIDHVLVPAGTTTLDFGVHDVSGSDHRAVVARLRAARADAERVPVT